MGKFGSPQIGVFAPDGNNYDNPNLNKCPNCGALFDGTQCPICKTVCPDRRLKQPAATKTVIVRQKAKKPAISIILLILSVSLNIGLIYLFWNIITADYDLADYYVYNSNKDIVLCDDSNIRISVSTFDNTQYDSQRIIFTFENKTNTKLTFQFSSLAHNDCIVDCSKLYAIVVSPSSLSHTYVEYLYQGDSDISKLSGKFRITDFTATVLSGFSYDTEFHDVKLK